MGKSRFDGTERLAFWPWQRFICIHCTFRRSTKADLLLSTFRSSCALCTGLVCFVQTQDEGAMCSKITFGMMLPEILEWANSVGLGDVQLLWLTSGSWCLVWRIVEGRSSNSLAQRWQSKRMFLPPPQPAAWFWNCGAKLPCSQFQHRSSSLNKKKKCQASISKPRPISSYNLLGGDHWDTTSFRKPAGARKRPRRFRWNLVPRLIDTRRFRISNPLKNSSTRKSKKNAA